MRQLIDRLARNLNPSQSETLSPYLSNPNLLKLYRPLEIFENKLVAQEPIKPQKEIMGISYQGIISSQRLKEKREGSMDEVMMKENSRKIAENFCNHWESKFYLLDAFVKLGIQASFLKDSKKSPLKLYAKDLYERTGNSPFFWNEYETNSIYSPSVNANLISLNDSSNYIIKQMLEMGIYGMQHEDTDRILSLLKEDIVILNFSKGVFDDNKDFDILTEFLVSPALNLLQHSYNPNCKITKRFNYMEREEYLTVEPIEEIKEGDILTIQKHNMDSEEYFCKQGIWEIDSPNNLFTMPLALDEEEYMDFYVLVQKKRKLFRKIPEFNIEKAKLTLSCDNSTTLATLRTFFASGKDLEGKSKFEDLESPISETSEGFMTEMMLRRLDAFIGIFEESRKTPETRVIMGDNFIFPSTLDELQSYLNTFENPRVRNGLGISIMQEMILRRNLEFFASLM